DRVFLFHHLFTAAGRLKYAALLAAIGAPWRGGVAEARPWFLTDHAPDRGYGIQHEADYWLEVAGLTGIRPPANLGLEIAIDDAARARASQLLGDRTDFERPRVALFPGSGPYSEGRRWPEASYVAVGRGMV